MNEYIGIVVSIVLAALVAAGMVHLGSIGKKKPTDAKLSPFECGMDPVALPIGKLAIKFYLTAILFILFDVELVFLYPWAVIYRSLGVVGLVEVGIFLVDPHGRIRLRLGQRRTGVGLTYADRTVLSLPADSTRPWAGPVSTRSSSTPS